MRNEFLTILAFLIGVFQTLLIFAKIYLNVNYEGSLQELVDKMKGYRRSWPVQTYEYIIVFICITLIICLN